MKEFGAYVQVDDVVVYVDYLSGYMEREKGSPEEFEKVYDRYFASTGISTMEYYPYSGDEIVDRLIKFQNGKFLKRVGSPPEEKREPGSPPPIY